MVTSMLLWVGLGNPSEKYKRQRHNVGFMIVDKIAIEYSFSPWRKKLNASICEGEIAGQKIMLVKPQSYMNNSGIPLIQIMRFFKILESSVYVFHDDIDLKPGKVRVKNGGGHGGHNGLRDIDAKVGENYWRIRVGIGRPDDKELVNKWVLSEFSKEECLNWLDFLLQAIVKESGQLAEKKHEYFNSQIAHHAPVTAQTQKENKNTGEKYGI